jgi:hypothetical protein
MAMTVRELVEKLKELDGDLEVWMVWGDRDRTIQDVKVRATYNYGPENPHNVYHCALLSDDEVE